MTLRIYVNGLDAWYTGFVRALQEQLLILDIAPERLPVYTDDAHLLSPQSLILYFSEVPHTPVEHELESLERHLQAGHMVLPVVDTVTQATEKLPSALHTFNAFPLGNPPQYAALVDEVLSRLWMRRTLRKVFISYKRSDSLAVAHQLRDALTRAHYDVFLDECSIDYGTHFQRELLWWLNDVDFVLLLASPHLDSSRWVMEEIEFANIAHVGLLALRWPLPPGSRGPAVLSSLMSDQIYALPRLESATTVAEQTLPRDELEKLLDTIAVYRAQAIQRRLWALLPYLTDQLEAASRPFTPTDRIGDLVLEGANPPGSDYIRVLPFRPTLDTLYAFGQEVMALHEPPARALLFYMENDPHDQRCRAFEWCVHSERTGETPSLYRLLPLTDGTFDLGRLYP